MFYIKKIFLLSILCSTPIFPQTKGSVVNNLNLNQQSLALALSNLINNHPEKEMVVNMDKWLKDHSVFISFESDQLPTEMASELVVINGKVSAVLIVNPNFLLRPVLQSKDEDKKYKELVVYHEYQHIANHFSGKARMPIGNFKEIGAKERAIAVWNTEYLATKAEWDLAKRLHCEHLNPTINTYVQKVGEDLGFLEAFYSMIMKGGTSNKPELLYPTWTEIYNREKSKILNRKGK